MQPRGLSDISSIYEAMAPWAVLATSVLTTCSGLNHFSTINLLAMPQQITGTIQQQGTQRLALVGVPTWFPLNDSVIETSGGELWCKIKSVITEAKTAPPQNKMVIYQFDLTTMPVKPETASFTLTYSPWFRFATEPVSFDICGRVAAYVAECIRFLFARSGIVASVIAVPDGCDLTTPQGLRIEVRGIDALSSIRLVEGDRDSTFHLAERNIAVDRRMFPAIYAAADAMLKTDDRPLNMTVSVDNDKARFVSTPKAS